MIAAAILQKPVANVLGLQVTVLCLHTLSSVSVIAFQHCDGVVNFYLVLFLYSSSTVWPEILALCIYKGSKTLPPNQVKIKGWWTVFAKLQTHIASCIGVNVEKL